MSLVFQLLVYSLVRGSTPTGGRGAAAWGRLRCGIAVLFVWLGWIMVVSAEINSILTTVSFVFTTAVLFFIGTTIVPGRIRAIANRESKDFTAFMLAMATTTIIQPLIGFWLLLKFRDAALSEAATVAILVVSCTPGGAFSNIISHLVGANVALNAALTMAETLMSTALVPFGLIVLLPHVRTGASTQDTIRVPVKHIIGAILSVVAPLSSGIMVASRCHRCKQATRWLAALNALLIVVFIIVSIGVAGVPPISAMSILVVSLNELIGIAIATVLAVCTRQPLSNAISLVLEINVRDLAMANAVIMIGFASRPLAFRLEAAALGFVYMVIWNQAIMVTALLTSFVIRVRGRQEPLAAMDGSTSDVVEIAEMVEERAGRFSRCMGAAAGSQGSGLVTHISRNFA